MSYPPIIAPSLLAADFGRLEEEVQLAASAGCEMLHLDVMDGRFVPNISFGLPIVEAVRRAASISLDVHLMIVEPGRYVEAFAEAGADRIAVHLEAEPHLHRVLQAIRAAGASPGLAINPATAWAQLKAALPLCEHVLVMTVNPGFGGQRFIPEALASVKGLAKWRQAEGLDYRIGVDGGIDPTTLPRARRAGADTFVAGTAFYGAGDRQAALKALQEAAGA